MDEQPSNTIPAESECLFCQIASKKVNAAIISETPLSIAFPDIKPASPGHIILIPKKHYQILPQIDNNELSELFLHAQKISHAVLSGLASKGVNGTTIMISQGQVAGQRAAHIIMHIIPQKDSSGILRWDSYKEDENKVYELASIIRDKVSGQTRPKQEATPLGSSSNDDIDLDKLSEAFGG
jgi:histidine triad (HIT) family protein